MPRVFFGNSATFIAYGGTFDAQLKLRVNIDFTNMATGKVFSVVRDVYLPTVNSTPFAMGAVAVACATPIDTAAVTLSDGRPLSSHPHPARSEKALVVTENTAVATGCLCNTSPPYQCLPVYSWHNPCATPGYDCEKHFTYTPCQLGYRDQCTAQPVQETFLNQLQVLYDRGYLHEKPATVLQKQLRSAEQIEKDQAARDREIRRQQQQ